MPTNYELSEIELLKLQMTLSSLFIITIIISLSLSYNEMLNLSKKKTIYTNTQSDLLLKINRIIIIILGLGYLYINYTDKNLKNNENFSTKEIKNANLQIGASVFSLIAYAIVLYVAFNSNNTNNFSVENPTL